MVWWERDIRMGFPTLDKTFAGKFAHGGCVEFCEDGEDNDFVEANA